MTAAPDKIWLDMEEYPDHECIQMQKYDDWDQAEYTRSDLANARIAELESALRLIVNRYGPNHMSKYARDVADSALK